jgi:hypothetical protein
MDWVENRAKRERQLLAGRQKLWDELCADIEQAVGSFNRHYKHGGHADFSNPQTEHQAWVRFQIPRTQDRTLRLTMRQDGSVEGKVTTDKIPGNTSILAFALNDQDQTVLTLDGKPVSNDQASRILLEPVLFESPVELNTDVD